VNLTLRMLRNPLYLVVVLVLGWAIVTFLLLPNTELLRAVFTDEQGAPSFRAFERLISSDRAVTSLVHSLILAVVISVTVNVVGIFLVLVTRFYSVRGARLLWLGYASTLICGGIVLVFGYKQVYGPTGFITRLVEPFIPGLDPNWFSGMFAVVVVLTFASTGNHLLFLSAALAKIDLQTIEAAKIMGASDVRILRRIVLPVLKPMIFAVTILTFIHGLSALAAPQLLGGREFQTVAPMILTFANSSASRDLAATLALLLGIATIALLAILNRIERGGVYFSVSKVPSPPEKQPIRNRAASIVVHVMAYLLWVVYLLPPVLILIFSFADSASIASGNMTVDSFTLDNYITVLSTERGLRPFLVSVGYGAVASIVVLVLMLFTARMVQAHRNPLTRAIEYLIHIPWLLPTTMIALGLILAFDHPQPVVLGSVLTGTVGILAIAYIIIKTPFTFRLLKAAFAGVPENLEEAASMLGANSLTIFRRVLLPLVLPTAAAIAALNFTSLLDEYDSAVFLSYPLQPPLGIVIKNATSGETIDDSTGLAYVYTVLLMLISAVALRAVYGRAERRRRRKAERTVTPPEPAAVDSAS
jgi:iron(III) transport system permease protein